MAREILSGIYKIQSKTKTDRCYIGSALDIYIRWRIHKRDLVRQRHHAKKLQNHFNKYGIDDLFFSIVAICDKKELEPIDKIIRPEQFFIWAYNPYFNSSPTAGSNIGVKMSVSARRKQSLAKKGKYAGKNHPNFGKPMPEDLKERLRLGNIGRKQSDETRRKRSLSMQGKKMPPEFGMAISKRMMGNKHSLGHRHSDKTKEILRQKSTGHVYSDDSRRKMSISHKGKFLSDQQKKKLSVSITAWWAKRKGDMKNES